MLFSCVDVLQSGHETIFSVCFLD